MGVMRLGFVYLRVTDPEGRQLMTAILLDDITGKRAQGDVVATAAGAAVMGHPAAAVAWLVNTLAPGDWHLKLGALVLPGGLTAPVPMGPGAVVSAEFDGLGAIEVYG